MRTASHQRGHRPAVHGRRGGGLRRAFAAIGLALVASSLAACQTGAGAREHALARTPIEGQPVGSALPAEPAPPTPGPPPRLSRLDAITPEVADAFGIVLTRRAPTDWAADSEGLLPTASADGGVADTQSAFGAVPASRALPRASRFAPAAPCAPRLPSCAARGLPECNDDGLYRGLVEERHPTGYVGLAGSLLPNVGLQVFGGRVIGGRCTAPTSLEAGLTWQFLDDEAFADDGNPEAGNWFQADVGLRFTRSIACARRSVLRVGASYVHAEGDPNILQFPGDYFGGYVGVGFEADLNGSVTIGPDLTVHVLTKDGSFTHGIVPQLTWRLSWWMGGTPTGGDPCRAPGEVYLSAAALTWPGLGGGVELGQRLHRGSAVDLSFEMLAGVQDLEDGTLGAEGTGDAAFLRGSLKALFAPRSRGHVTARLGVGWFRTTVEVDGVATPGDYIGLCAGLGYELDLGGCWRTGPEVSAYLAAREGTTDIEVLPQVTWRFTLLL